MNWILGGQFWNDCNPYLPLAFPCGVTLTTESNDNINTLSLKSPFQVIINFAGSDGDLFYHGVPPDLPVNSICHNYSEYCPQVFPACTKQTPLIPSLLPVLKMAGIMITALWCLIFRPPANFVLKRLNHS